MHGHIYPFLFFRETVLEKIGPQWHQEVGVFQQHQGARGSSAWKSFAKVFASKALRAYLQANKTQRAYDG